jgi:putative FmdB family regulatory protein
MLDGKLMEEFPSLRWFMPIYTYRCEHCGVQFDRRQKFSDNPITVCPECGTETLRKVYLPVGIVFKGSGFYATDNRSPSGMESRQVEDHTDSASDTTDKEKKPVKKKEKTKEAKKDD